MRGFTVPFFTLLVMFGVPVTAEAGEAGTDRLSLTQGDRAIVSEQEPNNTCPGQAINCGDLVNPAHFSSPSDVDWYSFTASAGTAVTIGTDGSDLCDPDAPSTEISLIGPDCTTVLAHDLDSGPGLFSLILNYPIPVSGTYHVRANTWNGTGCYKLSVTCGALPTGACCLSGSLCQILPSALCGTMGGIYQGDNATCSPSACPIPPVNDTCSGALVLGRCSTGNVDGTTIYAADSYWNTMGCLGVDDHGKDVTYRIELFAGDVLDVTYWPMSMDGGVYLVRDCNNTAGSCVAGADQNLWAQPESFHHTVAQTGTYFLIIDAYDWNAGGPNALHYAISCGAETVGDGTVSTATELYPGAPNPFSQSTAIHYSLAQAGPVRLEIFDAGGRLVRRLADDVRPAGSGSFYWDRRDDQGRRVASGSYYCRMRTRESTQTQMLVALK